ncbi:MAG: anti-sigma factor antagonist [Candidatus Fermentithermobacillus carboniphilus]|uniref:Anti-sigma factor antagonist n=1 Tax=Candidatus Fermentithermobacillus carboniphilus TaxID=3085328 RepID=A0AAT9LCV0_9FIRM|nr:MAG: anti-sigma factor antagonist [Candidatus Fermentithermobacillus carboniphilus]
MDLTFQKVPPCLLAKLSGELDLSTAPVFRERVDQELRRTGVPNLILNLKELTFVDSTGLGAILGRHKLITASGGEVFLVEVPPKVMSMLEMAGLLSVFKVARTQEEALRLLCQGPATRGEGEPDNEE